MRHRTLYELIREVSPDDFTDEQIETTMKIFTNVYGENQEVRPHTRQMASDIAKQLVELRPLFESHDCVGS